MAHHSSRLGRRPIVAARLVRAMRALSARNVPITTSALRKQEPGIARSTVLQAIQRLQETAGLLVRVIPGTQTREYCLGSQAARWGYGLDAERVRASAREENRLLLLLADHERGAK